MADVTETVHIERTPEEVWDYFTNIANDGSEPWTVAGPTTTNAIIRVQAHDFPPFDVSDAVFSIVNPGIQVLSPNGGAIL